MLRILLQAELLKIKRKVLWLLVFLGPFGVVSLQVVNYGVRKDYLLSQEPDAWKGLMHEVNIFIPTVVILGATILTTQLAAVEYDKSSWKQLLSLPIKRNMLYVAKFLIVLCMLFISSCLLFVGTYLVGLGFGFGQPNFISKLILNSFYPFFAVIPVVATQLWIAILYQNQSKALSLGIMMGVFILYAGEMPFWFI